MNLSSKIDEVNDMAQLLQIYTKSSKLSSRIIDMKFILKLSKHLKNLTMPTPGDGDIAPDGSTLKSGDFDMLPNEILCLIAEKMENDITSLMFSWTCRRARDHVHCDYTERLRYGKSGIEQVFAKAYKELHYSDFTEESLKTKSH